MIERRQEFASDNTAGLCPEAGAALQDANAGAAAAYGDDQWTQRLCDRVRELFEIDCDVFVVSNGTAANALALAQLCQPFHSVSVTSTRISTTTNAARANFTQVDPN